MNLLPFWSISVSDILQQLQTTQKGLTTDEAQLRLKRSSSRHLRTSRKPQVLVLLLSQFTDPIGLILLFAAGISLFLQDTTDAIIILIIVFVSGLLSFWQEYGANDAVQKLLAQVQVTATILRNGAPQGIPTAEVVPGDIVILHAGDLIPGDCRLLDGKDLFIDESALTGETYPAEKVVGVLPPTTPLAQRKNTLFLGTHVVSGEASAVVVSVGAETAFGKISQRLNTRPPVTEFERGIRHFGSLLLEITLILVISIFAINVYFHRPVLDSLLFALALAVGLTPQLLPAIISINLAAGAKRMASQQVIVRRLNSIENFGSMNVLCSDKTGTLTEGLMRVHAALQPDAQPSKKVLFYAYLNAFFQSGFPNPTDQALRTYGQDHLDVSTYKKQDEVPYDFLRKRLTIVVDKDDLHLMVTKGAVPKMLEICTSAELAPGTVVKIAQAQAQIHQCYQDLSAQGFHTLALAYKEVTAAPVTKDDEKDMTFLGFLVFEDPPKPGIIEAIAQLKQLGVSLKVITGDNRLVAAHVGQQVGIATTHLLTGSDLHAINDTALVSQVNDVDIFAEVEPNQKERLLLALRKAGNVVGYMGDGINDAPALHAADVGISVDSAVDVAKEAADLVLLAKDLSVLVQGVREGRRTFANTLKYVFMATSANFGNMFSMAGASLFLSFLPLLPKQILLTNVLTDIPETTISTDSVDDELVQQPRRWNITFIRNFMLVFGLLSSVFDYLTFGVLLFILHANVAQFRTGWFLESVCSAALIVLVIRSQRPFFRSKPSLPLLGATLIIVGCTLVLPYTPLAPILGFEPLNALFVAMMAAVVVLYILTAEYVKRWFYRRVSV